jgi:preprotein translocase subunit SecE
VVIIASIVASIFLGIVDLALTRVVKYILR